MTSTLEDKIGQVRWQAQQATRPGEIARVDLHAILLERWARWLQAASHILVGLILLMGRPPVDHMLIHADRHALQCSGTGKSSEDLQACCRAERLPRRVSEKPGQLVTVSHTNCISYWSAVHLRGDHKRLLVQYGSHTKQQHQSADQAAERSALCVMQTYDKVNALRRAGLRHVETRSTEVSGEQQQQFGGAGFGRDRVGLARAAIIIIIA